MRRSSAESTLTTVPSSPQRILVSGASGFIGSKLVPALQTAGAEVTKLTRNRAEAGEVDPELVSGFDAVIHLAGEPVGTGRWTAEKKRKIYDSRIHGTRILAEALAAAKEPPRVFLCASGSNYYPSSGGEVLTETAPAGSGFLSKVCVAWEHSANIASAVSRVVTMRIGVVLSEDGGTLGAMLPLFRWGLGGFVGSGASYLSWITLHDVVRAILHLLRSDLAGPVNVVSPGPVTGRAFAQALGAALNRPAWFRIPTPLMRLALGEFADETILSSVRAVPSTLVSDGFAFESATLESALTYCLNDAHQPSNP